MTNRQTDHATCVATGRIFTLCIAMRAKNYNERQNWRHHFNMNRTKLVVNMSSLLLATARARCVFVHVAVSVRLPSPRALRRSAYINQCDGRSAGKYHDGLCNQCSEPETVSHFLTECNHSPKCLAVLAVCKRLNLAPTLDVILSDGRLHNTIVSSLDRKL